MKKPIVIGIGEYLWDVFPDVRKACGAPVNFAFHASHQGVRGVAVSAVGDDDLGGELIEAAANAGIELIAPALPYPTGTVQVTLEDGQPSYEITENVAWDHIPVTDQVLALAREASAVCFGSLAQRSPESRKSITSLVKALPLDALKIFDINLRQDYFSKELVEESLGLCNVLKINNDEAVILAEMMGCEAMDEDQFCRHLVLEYGLKYLVLTAGEHYSAIYSADGGKSLLPTPKVELVDAVGAGDSFTGAFVAALLGGDTMEEAHRRAVTLAAEVCTKAGAWTV